MANEAAQPAGTRKQGFLLLSVVFLLGIVCGGALVFIGVRTLGPGSNRFGGAPPPHPMIELSRQLDLDEDQERKIRMILDQTREEMQTVMHDSREKIREVLRPEQREKMDEIRPRFRRGFGGRRRGKP